MINSELDSQKIAAIFRILSFAFIGLLVTAPKSLELEIKEPSGSAQVLPVADTTFENTIYVSSEILEYLFKTSGNPVPDRQKYIIKDKKDDLWYLTVDNPYVLVGKKVYNTIYPIRRGANFIYLPLEQTLKILKKEYGFSFGFDADKLSLVKAIEKKSVDPPPDGRINILDISKNELKNGSIVDIQLACPLAYHTMWVPPHFIIAFNRGVLNKELVGKRNLEGLVRSIVSVQEDSSAQVTLYIPQPVDTVEPSFSEPDKKLSVLIRKPMKVTTPVKEKEKPKANIHKKTIIIDPGHGGRDPGAVAKKVKEKDIVLKVAKKLKSKLKKNGYRVLMTREKDAYLSLQERPKFAAESGGDLFISLHCNAIDGPPKRLKAIEGFVAYILRAGESEEDKALARRENQAVMQSKQKQSKTEISPVEWILLEHELNLYSHQSERFAEKIVHAFNGGKITKHRTGAHQAGFFVLVGAFMPAVLFEMGFITNDRDRKYLVTKKGQEDIAQRLSLAITDFFLHQ